MKKIMKIALFGFILWLVCFIVAVIVWPLYDSQFLLFKSIMVVTGTLVGMYLLVYYFKKIGSNYVKEGVVAGIIWFVVNIVLDLIVLVGILKTPLIDYLISPGVGYLCMPVMSTGVGLALANKK
jgi:hypothetical protein